METRVSTIFGKGIRHYRTGAGLTTLALGRLIGVAPQTVTSWETGRTEPSLYHICQMCSVFRATFEDIFSKGLKEAEDEGHQ